MILFILVGGLIGLFAGGVSGLLVGLILGWGLGLLVFETILPRALGVNQEQFLDSTFAVMGAVCKADGKISPEEIRVVEHFFGLLGLSPEQRQAAQASFDRGKCEGFDLAGEVGVARGVVGNNRPLLQLFLQVQLSAIAADGIVNDHEHRIFLRIALFLGLGEDDVERLLATLRGASGTSQTPDDCLHDAYATLGVSPSDSEAEIKLAYRRLMSRHHPDKLASRGMPDSMRPIAEKRVREVRRAYDMINEQRSKQLP
jgi:DnaJ like chaperone protein